MPSYEYRCESCGKFQFTQSIKDKPLADCPTCGRPVKRLIGKNVNIILKGSGFYSTDHRNTNTNGDSAGTGKESA